MSLARLEIKTGADEEALAAHTHILVVMPAASALPRDLPGRERLLAVLARRQQKIDQLAKTPVAADLPSGGRCAWVMIDGSKPRFAQLSSLRAATQLLLEEHPAAIAIAVAGVAAHAKEDAEPSPRGLVLLAREAVYVALINGVPLPGKKKQPAKPLKRIVACGPYRREDFSAVVALARGNTLARELTMLPANELAPGQYRSRIQALAQEHGWGIDEYDVRRLAAMGAGAFCAVAHGSQDAEAAIVHLSHKPRGARRQVALVGKGICFDTGGHNLKPARHMAGMHEDMNGSAVALGLMLAAQELKLPLAIDAWLPIAQNQISPSAYKQGDVLTALDGTTIEVVHTDAEGRLVLADAITLAVRNKPDLLLDFATLTGSMATALGSRYAGVFASSDALAAQAHAAGRSSGERVCIFPWDEDYDVGLESKIADVKQCAMESEADHILGARLLSRFVKETPWLHMDLSAANCRDGLGAAGSDITGFGVAWGAAFLAEWIAEA